jgi:hypothetical protein
MRGAWLVPIALCALLAGCAPPSGSQPAASSAPSTAGVAQPTTGLAQPVPASRVPGTWTTSSTMKISGLSVPASTTAVFKADGTVSIDSESANVGQLFGASGTWKLAPDGVTIQAVIEDTPSSGTLNGNQLIWLNMTWTRQ